MLERAVMFRVLPFATYLAFMVITDIASRADYAAEQLRWLYAMKVGAVLVLLLIFRRHYSELANWRPRLALPAIAAGLAVMVLWIHLDHGWMVMGHSRGYDPRNDGSIDWLLVTFRLAGAALIVPVMEELFWRSFLLRFVQGADFLSIAPASVGLKAVLVSVALFGIEHNQWLAGVVAGLVYTALYVRTGVLWVPVLAHMVTNFALGCWIISTGQWTYW